MTLSAFDLELLHFYSVLLNSLSSPIPLFLNALLTYGYHSLQVGRAGRFGTKGLAITFVSSASDSEVLNQVVNFVSMWSRWFFSFCEYTCTHLKFSVNGFRFSLGLRWI